MKSQRLIIEGGNALSGEIKVQGAKNSSLPSLTDTYASCRILTHLGCTCRFEGNTLTIKPDGINKTEIPDELMREMRSSIIYMGALLGRCGKCGLSFPGGCELGPRPIDMHLSAMKKMGAKVNDEYGTIECTQRNKNYIEISFCRYN